MIRTIVLLCLIASTLLADEGILLQRVIDLEQRIADLEKKVAPVLEEERVKEIACFWMQNFFFAPRSQRHRKGVSDWE